MIRYLALTLFLFPVTFSFAGQDIDFEFINNSDQEIYIKAGDAHCMYSVLAEATIKPHQTLSASYETKGGAFSECGYEHSSFNFQYTIGNNAGSVYQFYFADGGAAVKSANSYIPHAAMQTNSVHGSGSIAVDYYVAIATTASRNIVSFPAGGEGLDSKPMKVHLSYGPFSNTEY
ncbi:hypothetical protein GCM10023116_28330 [Kistimonas scapharcae]|uniref:Uncharacterized protein n=1 Tax=Kistimonas scapharcae TaxID=1036133 RepID=A0ABP8V378_9GAMM